MASNEVLRPSAFAVIGLGIVLLYGLSLFGAVSSFAQLELLREQSAIMGTDGVPIEVQLGVSVAIAALLILAGVGVMRRRSWGMALCIGVMAGSAAFGYLVQPSLINILPSILIIALLALRFYVLPTRITPEQEPSFVATGFWTLFLSFAAFMCAGALAFLYMLIDPSVMVALGADLGSEDPVAFMGIMISVFGGLMFLFWVIGAAMYRFRWSAATFGWVFIGGGTTLGLFYLSFFLLASMGGGAATGMPPGFDDMVARVDQTVLATIAGVSTALGLILVALQRSREAAQRAATSQATAEAFR
ncbi:MAG: hypothetical protein AAF909_09800 [Pseudomonadota bacterium]